MFVTSPFRASRNIALWRAYSKPPVIDKKLWPELSPNSQSCKMIDTDPQCFKYYNGVFDKTQELGRKENNPLPSKEDNWIIRT